MSIDYTVKLVPVNGDGAAIYRKLNRVGTKKLYVNMSRGDEASFWLADGSASYGSWYRNWKIDPAHLAEIQARFLG
jgi:hypothetical protein